MSKAETHHLKNVLRIKAGDSCLFADGKGSEYVGRVKEFLKNGTAIIELLKPCHSEARSRTEDSEAVVVDESLLTVAQAIPQRSIMDEIARKAAELGISKLIPLMTERTMVRLKADQTEKVRARWERIARETIKQSRVEAPPRVESPVRWKDFLGSLPNFDAVFLFHLSPEAKLVRHEMNGRALKSILLLIGPEGGFSPAEVLEAREAGAIPVRLNTGVLKTDTAFVAAVACVRQFLG